MQIIKWVVRHMHKYCHVDLGPASHVFSILLCLAFLLLPESPEGVSRGSQGLTGEERGPSPVCKEMKQI
jgi:hypothetical protein